MASFTFWKGNIAVYLTVRLCNGALDYIGVYDSDFIDMNVQ